MSIVKSTNQDTKIKMHKMKKIEIVVKGEHENIISTMIEKDNIPGYTIIRNISGKGHKGYHEGKSIYNDQTSLIMFVIVAPEEEITNLAQGMRTLFQKNSGVMFVSDVEVARAEYFYF